MEISDMVFVLSLLVATISSALSFVATKSNKNNFKNRVYGLHLINIFSGIFFSFLCSSVFPVICAICSIPFGVGLARGHIGKS